MSADVTAKTAAKMLESKEFAQQVANDPAATLGSLDLNPNEKKMLAEAAVEGIVNVFRVSSADELADADLEQVAGGVTVRPPKLTSYLASASLSPDSFSYIQGAITRNAGLNLAGNPTQTQTNNYTVDDD